MNITYKRGAKLTAMALGVVVGWLVVMAAYFAVYAAFENSALPVSVGSKEWYADKWDSGYFRAAGSLSNDIAIEDGDDVPLNTMIVECHKDQNNCSFSTANVYDGYLSLDTSNLDITEWNASEIKLDDDTPACAELHWTISKSAQSYVLRSNKKAVIPDYMKKGPITCDHTKDMVLSLKDGFQVWWHRKKFYEQRVGIYFHTALVFLNLGFAFLVYRLWQRSRSEKIMNGVQSPTILVP